MRGFADTAAAVVPAALTESKASPAYTKEALIKSKRADLRQKFPLARKKIAGILTDFKIF